MLTVVAVVALAVVVLSVNDWSATSDECPKEHEFMISSLVYFAASLLQMPSIGHHLVGYIVGGSNI